MGLPSAASFNIHNQTFFFSGLEAEEKKEKENLTFLSLPSTALIEKRNEKAGLLAAELLFLSHQSIPFQLSTGMD